MTIGGPLLKPVTVQQGFIDQLTVTNGIGAAGSPVNIRASNGVLNLKSQANAYMNLDAAWNGGSGVLSRLEVTGNLTGTVRAKKLTGPTSSTRCALIVHGNLDADVTILGSVTGKGDLNFNVVRVDGDFAQGRTFSIGDTVFLPTIASAA